MTTSHMVAARLLISYSAGDSTGGRARSLRKRRCQSPVERDAATERDCVSAFASRNWTVVAKGAIRVRFHSLVFVL